MIRAILADHNLAGHLKSFRNQVWLTLEWIEFWNDLGITIETFESLGLDSTISDTVLWQYCQQQHFVLLTANRNQEDDESLNAVILSESTADSLPVITISNATRIWRDRKYADAVAIKILDHLIFIDDLRGTGRQYAP